MPTEASSFCIPHIAQGTPISRRAFLRSSGIALALPMLGSMFPVFAQPVRLKGKRPARLFAICNNLGLLSDRFFPASVGFGYEASPYLSILEEHRTAFTVFSGFSHPEVDGGHPADNCFLTGAPHPASANFRNTISLDQLIAEEIGIKTRFPSLSLGVNVQQGARSLSWTGSGAMIPPEDRASEVFKALFLQGSPAEISAQTQKLREGRSILDSVYDQGRQLQAAVPAADRDRIDQYFTSVRSLERGMYESEAWLTKPKPVVSRKAPIDPPSPKDYMAKVKQMYDLAVLAFQSDSTRCISLLLDGVNSPALEIADHAITDGYHNLSHHGQSAEKLDQLVAIDTWHMRLLKGLLHDLRQIQEDDSNLLDNTMVMYGSNLGNANVHTNTNLPILFAGGGFRHGAHIRYDGNGGKPLSNLFVSILQRMDLEIDQFSSSRGRCFELGPG
jgi:hypothetical protein